MQATKPLIIAIIGVALVAVAYLTLASGRIGIGPPMLGTSQSNRTTQPSSEFNVASNQSNRTTQPSSEFNVAFAGDWGCNNDSLATINNIESKDPSVVVAVGDLSYNSTFDCWLDAVKPLDAKMHIVLGNHDAGPKDAPTAIGDVPNLLNHYHLAKPYYSFNYKDVHFTIISAENPISPSSPQYKFVNSDLAQASTNSSIKWKIALFHHVAYTSPTNIHTSYAALRDTYHPLFDKYHVDFVIQGHNHNYQRMYPLRYNPIDPSSPIITTTEKSNYTTYDGEIWLVVGTGGESHYTLTGKAPFVVSQEWKSFGFLDLAFTNNDNAIRGTFYSNNGQELDTFNVTKPVAK